MRVLVCGSRTFEDLDMVYAVLDGIARSYPDMIVIHGAARGADRIAQMWTEDRGHTEEPYHAEWHKHGNAAGPIRNQRMLHKGKPDRALAFVDKPLPESRGTNDMVTRARKARVPVYVIERLADGGEQ